MSGEVWIRATIALATVAYAVAECVRFRHPAGWRRARAAWTAAALLTLGHVAAAFHVRHAWSHRDAYAATAAQTAAVTGVDWGGGLYVNYVFLAIWLADALWWWRDPRGYTARSDRFRTARAAVFFFMFLNGAVVFAHGAMRWLGAICLLLVGAAWYWRSANRLEAAAAQSILSRSGSRGSR